jgi:type I restriction enzyme S subunit
MGEWKECKLSDIAEVVGGFAFKSSEFGEVGFPVVKIKDIVPPNVAVESCEMVDISAYDERRLENYRLKECDYLVAMTGATIGKVGRIRKGFHGYLNQRVARIRAKPEFADNDFIYFCVAQHEFQEFVVNAASGSSVQENASATDIGDYELLLPPLPEQRAIASVLTSLDDKIDLLHGQNKTLEKMADTLFRQWFIEEAEERWEEKSLDKIADYLNGLACQKYPSESLIDRLPVIKIKELRGGFTEASDCATSKVPDEYIIDMGDIIFSWSGSLEIVIWGYGKGVLNQHLFKVTSERYPRWFYYLATKSFLSEFRGIAEDKATTMGHIQRHHLSDAKLPVPPVEDFPKLNGTMEPVFDKIISNLRTTRTLTQMRDALLPKLMSGEVRVKI